MAKIIAMYKTPTDAAAFDRYYFGPHLKLAKAVPGLKGYEVILWHGMIAPKGLPKPILDRVNGELNKILQNKDMQDKLAGDGVSSAGGTPEQFAALIKRDIEVWRKVVQKAGVKAE